MTKLSPHNSELSIDVDLLHKGSEKKTLWMNLGYWTSHSQSYPDACAALARVLGEHAQLCEGLAILDVGCGCGEQLRFWREEFKVGPIHALDPNPTHISRAKDLTKEMQGLSFEQASAADFSASSLFDRILALDCAYHFPRKEQFFKRAFDTLKDRGRLAYTDLFLGPKAKAQSSLRNLCARFCEVPPENLQSLESTDALLHTIGFTDIRITQIQAEVFGGFAQFVSRLKHSLRRERFQRSWLKIWLTGQACHYFHSKELLVYGVVSARKAP